MPDCVKPADGAPRAATVPGGTLRAAWVFLSGATARKGMVTLADQGIVSATNFLTGILVGRAVPEASFGVYVLGLTVVMFMVEAQTALVSTPFTVFHPRLKEGERPAYAGSSLMHFLGLAGGAMVLFVLGGVALLFGRGPSEMLSVARTLAAVVGFILLREFLRRISFARLRMGRALLLDACVSALQLGGLLALMRGGLLTPSRAYLVMGGACGVTALAALLGARRGFSLRGAQPLRELRRSWGLSKWLLLGIVVFWFASHSYPWLIAAFHDTAETGAYGACLRVIFIANVFMFGAANLLGPKMAHAFAEGGGARVTRAVLQATVVLAAPMLGFCLLMQVFGGPLVPLLFRGKYDGYAWTVRLLAMEQLVVALAYPINKALVALERADVNFKSCLIALAGTLLFGIWLVKGWGTAGAAAGSLIGSAGASAYKAWAFRRHVREKMYQVHSSGGGAG